MINTNSLLASFFMAVSLCWVGVVESSELEDGGKIIVPLSQPEAYQQRLVDWIRSDKNGFFHPSVVWKRLGSNGPYAMHTTEDIPKGEALMVLPRSYIIDSFKTHDECVTVARMLHEYKKGDDSFYAPYLSYLFDEGGTSTGLLPTSWSEKGQELLQLMLNHIDEDGIEQNSKHRLEPRGFIRPGVFDECGESFLGETDDSPLEDSDIRQQAEDAYLFWLSRSWTDKMIPVIDMYNHCNGKSKNVETTSAHYTDDDITAYAIRDIQAGEQLQISYSECMDKSCDWGAIQYNYVTQPIFTDYGFLEKYPRRWELGAKGNVIAEIDINNGQKTFHWIFKRPSEKTIQWISNQLERLHAINDKFQEDVANHKITPADATASHHNIEHEADTLLELYEGYVEVLEMALEHKDDPVGVTSTQFYNNLKASRKEADFDEL